MAGFRSPLHVHGISQQRLMCMHACAAHSCLNNCMFRSAFIHHALCTVCGACSGFGAQVAYSCKNLPELLIAHCGLQFPLLMVIAFLAGRQAICMAGNLTINELLNSHRYDYLRRDDDTFYNRFDRGPLANCLQFWSSGPVAWDDMYHQERLVSCNPCYDLFDAKRFSLGAI